MANKKIRYEEVKEWCKTRFYNYEGENLFLPTESKSKKIATEIIEYAEAVLFLEKNHPGIIVDFYSHLHVGIEKFKEALENQYGGEHGRFFELEKQAMHEKLRGMLEEEKGLEEQRIKEKELQEALQYLALRN